MYHNNKSSEDYLETILLLKQKMGNVRSIDIVNETGYKKSSISVAMKKLRENNCITVDNDGFLELTEKGYEIAKNVYEKHSCLKNFFIKIGVDPEIASEDACKIEHEISDETFLCIKNLYSTLIENND